MQTILHNSSKVGVNNKNGNLFAKLAQAVYQYDDKCPINQQIKLVQDKIVRKRARIHLVQTEGQKGLWSKEGSYEPGTVYEHQKKQSQQLSGINKSSAHKKSRDLNNCSQL